MARPLRLEFEDAIYHLLARGNARQQVFASERDEPGGPGGVASKHLTF